MSIDLNELRKLADSSRIELSKEEEAKLLGMVGLEIQDCQHVREVDTAGIEPMVSPFEEELEKAEDKVSDGNIPEAVLKNAPKAYDDYFLVPKVVEK